MELVKGVRLEISVLLPRFGGNKAEMNMIFLEQFLSIKTVLFLYYKSCCRIVDFGSLLFLSSSRG